MENGEGGLLLLGPAPAVVSVVARTEHNCTGIYQAR